MEWKSNRQRNKPPNVWTTHIGPLKISVVYNHIYYPDEWTFSCWPFYEHEPVNSTDPLEAQKEALGLVRLALEDVLEKLQ